MLQQRRGLEFFQDESSSISNDRLESQDLMFVDS